jgi:hypothetical protein
MARQLIDDGAQIHRVIVTEKKLVRNPDYDPSKRYDPVDNPQMIRSETETETKFYGPYLSQGAAKVRRTQVTRDGYGEPCDYVIGSHIEKGHIVWEQLPD